jgi:hypothetical protein
MGAGQAVQGGAVEDGGGEAVPAGLPAAAGMKQAALPGWACGEAEDDVGEVGGEGGAAVLVRGGRR